MLQNIALLCNEKSKMLNTNYNLRQNLVDKSGHSQRKYGENIARLYINSIIYTYWVLL